MSSFRNLLPAFVILGSLIGGASQAAPEFTVITDYDDTIKIADGVHTARTIERSFFSHAAYAGTSELLRSLAGENPWVVVTGSPFFLRGFLEKFFDKNNLSVPEIHHRATLFDEIGAFKTKALLEIMETHPEPFVLMGDDVQKDPEVYAEFAKSYPDRVKAIYIRRVRGRALSPEVAPFVQTFLTFYEVADHEMQEGRLREEQVTAIGDAILKTPNRRFFPKFMSCPHPEDLFSRASAHPALHRQSMRILNRIYNRCH